MIDCLVDLARRSGRRLMVRLVKGAYWDSEIKRAQVDGLDGYPVYTRKVYTDVSYLACARKLLAAPDAVYPQFATHNAHTLAAIHTLAGPDYYAGQYEFQCLHGMGEPLYEQVVGGRGKLDRPCRIYAPVGTHETLLAYLVRRLLENGANTSFVNRIADETLSLDELVPDPVRRSSGLAERDGAVGLPHPAIPLPRDLYGAAREQFARPRPGRRAAPGRAGRSAGAGRRRDLAGRRRCSRHRPPRARRAPVRNPADRRDVVGQVREADAGRRSRPRCTARTPGRAGLGRHAAGRARRSAGSAPPTLLEADTPDC